MRSLALGEKLAPLLLPASYLGTEAVSTHWPPSLVTSQVWVIVAGRARATPWFGFFLRLPKNPTVLRSKTRNTAVQDVSSSKRYVHASHAQVCDTAKCPCSLQCGDPTQEQIQSVVPVLPAELGTQGLGPPWDRNPRDLGSLPSDTRTY